MISEKLEAVLIAYLEAKTAESQAVLKMAEQLRETQKESHRALAELLSGGSPLETWRGGSGGNA